MSANAPALDFALEQLLHQRMQLKLEIKQREVTLANIDKALRRHLAERQLTTDQIAGYKLTLVETTRHSLDKLRLVELGVPIATLDAATKETTSSALRVTKGAEEDQ